MDQEQAGKEEGDDGEMKSPHEDIKHGRHDTSWRQPQAVAPMPPGYCLGAIWYKFAISSLGALYQGGNASMPLPF